MKIIACSVVGNWWCSTSKNLAQTRARILLAFATNNTTYTEPLPVWVAPSSALRKAKKQAKVKNETAFVSVLPNPAQEYVTVQFQNTLEKASISVYNIDGKQIMSTPISKDDYSITIPTQDWTNGVYTYCITSLNEQVYNGKIIILK